jgi:hypothetical protein
MYRTDWRLSMSDFRVTIDGDFPGLSDFSNQDYSLFQDSQRIDAGIALPSSIPTKHHLPFQGEFNYRWPAQTDIICLAMCGILPIAVTKENS